ncbi:hypothetical protein D3C76_1747850 [compost metagenome]
MLAGDIPEGRMVKDSSISSGRKIGSEYRLSAGGIIAAVHNRRNAAAAADLPGYDKGIIGDRQCSLVRQLELNCRVQAVSS